MTGMNRGCSLRQAPLVCLMLGAAACAQSGVSSQSQHFYTASANSHPAVFYPSSSGERLQWPISHGVVSSPFGLRHGAMHKGIDIAAPVGTPVQAAGSGEVIFAGKIRGYGRTVILRHDVHRVTLYAHNRTLRVTRGQHVRRGQVIATVGRSGHASGPNLHFEVRVDEHTQNPLYYLEPRPHLITFAKQSSYY
jgi:murein DD-endopeptidase MepM/ murein hydrolase activator NlpD